MKEKLQMAFMAMLVIFAFCAIIYGCYYVAKYVSYSIFYEDMVIETIRDTVKSAYLN